MWPLGPAPLKDAGALCCRPASSGPSVSGGWTRADATPELLYPLLANCAVATAGAAAWQWGAWATVSAALPGDYCPHGVHLATGVSPTAVVLAPFRFELEVAAGPAGSEETYALVGGAVICAANPLPAIMLVGEGYTLPLGVTTLAAGTRLVARLRKSVPDTQALLNVGLYVTGHQPPVDPSDPTYGLDAHLGGAHQSRLLLAPTGAALTPQPAAYPNYGPWLAVMGQDHGDLLIWGSVVTTPFSLLNSGHHLQLGLGPPQSATPAALIGCPVANMARGQGVQTLRRPLLLTEGEALSIRVSGPGAASSHQILYEEL